MSFHVKITENRMSSSANFKGVSTKRIKPENKKIPDGYKLVPPDGNYGWIVLFGCCIAGAYGNAPLNVFSVLLYDLLSFHNTNAETLSWIPSIILATSQFTGPVNTVILNTIGIRKAAFLGGFLTSLGLIMSYFADRIELLYITYGFITGFGLGLGQMCHPIVLSQYFRRNYGVACGLFFASFAAGRFVHTLQAQFLQEEYGCRGVFLIVGACALHICVAACLFQPIKRHLVLVPIDSNSNKLIDQNEEMTEDKSNHIKDNDAVAQHEDAYAKENNHKNNYNNRKQETIMPINDEETEIDKNRNSLVIYSNEFGSVASIAVKEKDTTNDVEGRPDGASNCFSLWSLITNIRSKIDLSLFCEPCFYIICGNGVINLGVIVYGNFFLFPMGVEKGCSNSQLAFIITFRVTADIVSRVIGPLLVTYFNLNVRKSYIYLGFLNGIIFAAVIFVNNYDKIIVWSLLSGLAYGPMNSLSRVLIIETMGAKRLPSVIGLSSFVQGVLLLPMAPILGWIRDTTGSFANTFLFLSFMNFVLITLWIIKPYLPQKPPENE